MRSCFLIQNSSSLRRDFIYSIAGFRYNMKNKSMIGLQSRNILFIFGTVVALLVSTSSQMQMFSASVEGGVPGSNTSNSNQGAAESLNPCITDPNKCKPTNNAEESQGGSLGVAPTSSSSGASSDSNQQAIDHINQAQSALQSGDTAGAQQHMDLAKQALGCSPLDPRGC
jgi:hypothetical protein